MFLQTWPTPKGNPTWVSPEQAIPQCCPEVRQYLKVCWTISTHLKTPAYEILHCVLAVDGIEKVAHLKISGRKYFIWVRALKNWRLPTQLIIFLEFLGKNIKSCPPSKIFLFTSLAHIHGANDRVAMIGIWGQRD